MTCPYCGYGTLREPRPGASTRQCGYCHQSARLDGTPFLSLEAVKR
jgi:hypothetical protein